MIDLETRLEAAIAREQRQVVTDNDPRLNAYMRAAAVLWQFRPEQLQPDAQKLSEPHEVERLLGDVVVRLRPKPRAYGGGCWTLQDELRPQFLDGIMPAELMRLRGKNPKMRGPEQKLVDLWFVGADTKLREYDAEQLAVLERIRGWFTTAPAHFPDDGELDRLRAMARFRAPLVRLVGGNFCGRRAELHQIRDFVFGPAPNKPALLVIHGVGGVGKSTVAAKFLLEAILSGDSTHAVGYLDFDEPKLDIADGVTLLLELARQGAAQLPHVMALHEVVTRAAKAMEELSAGNGHAPGRALAAKATTQELATDYGAALRANGVSRVTIVLDTFEEIQFANADHVSFLRDQLAILDASLPQLRTLLVSRASINLSNARQLSIEELDDDAARAYLSGRKIRKPEHIDAALALAKGNPLSLKLAADTLTKLGAEGLQIDAKLALEQELVQGQLYQRILQHIHDREIQKLAHPGLVVRRVTPDLIQEVLAVPCGLGQIDTARAEELFARLAREVSLVRHGTDGALEHRPDVRRVMLRLLYRDRPQLARDIHERAAAFYGKRHDEIAIAEEAYHRFALGEQHGPWLDRLSGSPAALRLRGALEELPEESWPVIASYTQIDLPEERLEGAKIADAERRLAFRIRDLLIDDYAEEAVLSFSPGATNVEQAIEMLENTPPRSPNSVLWRWQGRALAQVGRPREALEALEKSLTSFVGPDDEIKTDRDLAINLARKLGDATALARLESESIHTASSVHPAKIQQRPSEETVSVPDRPTWLDDQELRLLVKEAVEMTTRDAGAFSDKPRSTHASNVYAHLIKLNQAPAEENGKVPLLEFAQRVQKTAHPTVESLKESLKGESN